MSDILMPAGDGTHRVIEAEAIRALMGHIEERDGGRAAASSSEETNQ